MYVSAEVKTNSLSRLRHFNAQKWPFLYSKVFGKFRREIKKKLGLGGLQNANLRLHNTYLTFSNPFVMCSPNITEGTITT